MGHIFLPIWSVPTWEMSSVWSVLRIVEFYVLWFTFHSIEWKFSGILDTVSDIL